MAQDFGDDMGNALLNFVTRQTENYLRFGRGRERAFDWWQRHYKKEGNTPEAAKAMAEKQSSREQVVVPFGTSEEAAYYAQVCRENGTYAAAYMDKQGNGFLAFAKEDAKTVAGYAPQFKDVMARLDEQRITDALNHAEPVDKKTMDSLTELTSYPDLPAEDVTVIPVTIRYKDAPDETSPSRARGASPCRQKGISMNEQLTLQATQREETKTVPLRRRKVCLMGTFALFAACALVLLIPHPAYAGVIGDFLDIPNMIKTWLLQIAATLFNTYFGVINQTLDARFISGPFNELFGTTEPYGVIKDFYQAGVIPVAHAILGLFMLMQLIKISQRIDATSTLPAVKDIVFLVVTYCILSYFIDNALDLVSAIYGIFNDLVGNVSDKLQSKNWYEPGIEMTKDDAADATFGGCFLLLIFGLISWVVGLVFYAVSMVVALGRSVQLYVYAAFSPIPISLLGFEETKQIGIGYLKNFAAAALAGVVMVLILYLYPHLVTALAVSGGLGKAEMLGLAQGVETFDSFGVIIKTIAVLITTMMGLVKSGSWAKEILGA